MYISWRALGAVVCLPENRLPACIPASGGDEVEALGPLDLVQLVHLRAAAAARARRAWARALARRHTHTARCARH